MDQKILVKDDTCYQIEKLAKFPFSLFNFKEYDGAKLFAALLLLTSFLFFVSNFISLLQRNLYTGFTVTLWSFIQSLFNAVTGGLTFLVILLPFSISYLMAWVIFDPKNAAMYALAITNILFGIFSILNPVDMIPDFLPLIGSLDDAFFGGSLIGLGVFIFTRAFSKSKIDEVIIKLMNQHNEQEALQLLLADKGIKISKSNNEQSQD